jgi:cob(I)alamin adenosyltransferase
VGGEMFKKGKCIDMEELLNEIQENLADIRDYWLNQKLDNETIDSIQELINETQDLVDKLYKCFLKNLSGG